MGAAPFPEVHLPPWRGQANLAGKAAACPAPQPRSDAPIYLQGEHGVAVTPAATLALGALREHVVGGRAGGSGNRPCWEGQKGQGDGDTL